MFDRLETWLIMALLLWVALCFLDERICKAWKRRKRIEKERKHLKSELKKKDMELEELKSQHKRNDFMDTYILEQRIEELMKDNASLQKDLRKARTLLEQKWASSCDMPWHSDR